MDSTPVDRVVEPSPVEEISPTTTAPGPNTTVAAPGPDNGAAFDIELGSEQQSLETEDEANANDQPSDTADRTGPPSDPASPQSNTTDSTNDTQPTEPAVVADTTTTVTTTTVTTTTVTTTTPPPEPSTALNICQPHLIDLQTLAVRLYNPQSDHQRAADFRRPASIRFLNVEGIELLRVNTAGAPTTGMAANSHGWMGEGGGTHAEFAQAPTPTYWGVLVDADLVAEWSTVQALDPSTTTWTTVVGCP